MAETTDTRMVQFEKQSHTDKVKAFVESLAAEDPGRFEPELDTRENDLIRFAHSGIQGIRDEMEDRYSVHIDVIKEFFPQDANGEYYIAFFGLFDGHGGNRCADFCSRQLLLASLEVLAPNKKLSELLKNLGDDGLLKQCFIHADESFRRTDRVQEREAMGKKVSGSTAVVAWVIMKQDEGDCKYDVVVASAGDSRCVLYDKGRTVALTRDHKPTDQHEQERIYEAGGFVSRKRVNACLAMSRAMGDFKFKQAPGLPPDQQAVTPVPDVSRVEVSPEAIPRANTRRDSSVMDESEEGGDSGSGHGMMHKLKHAVDTVRGHSEDGDNDMIDRRKKRSPARPRDRTNDTGGENDLSFLIMACDGVWDVMSNEEATAYVARRMAKKTRRGSIGGGKDTMGRYPLDRVCTNLCDHCVRDLGSTDNVSVSIIQFKRV